MKISSILSIDIGFHLKHSPFNEWFQDSIHDKMVWFEKNKLILWTYPFTFYFSSMTTWRVNSKLCWRYNIAELRRCQWTFYIKRYIELGTSGGFISTFKGFLERVLFFAFYTFQKLGRNKVKGETLCTSSIVVLTGIND